MPSATTSSLPSLITERCIDSARPIKVIYIGAGVSGICSAIRLPEKVKNLELTIYDKNPEVGGTWWENRYPGVACGAYKGLYGLE
jgi:cation diffusion facilitator CzcD-associated flavoprotein CzcO